MSGYIGASSQGIITNVDGGTVENITELSVKANSTTNLVTITQTGSGNALVVEDSANPDSTPFVIDQFGRVVGGAQSSIPVACHNGANNFSAKFVSSGVDGISGNAIGLVSNSSTSSTNNIGGNLSFNISRNDTPGQHTICGNNDHVGTVMFGASDGTKFIRAAAINAVIDGTPGTNDMPGRLVFSTTADGASSPTERMRIDSSGQIYVGSNIGSSTASVLAPAHSGATSATNKSGFYKDTTTMHLHAGGGNATDVVLALWSGFAGQAGSTFAAECFHIESDGDIFNRNGTSTGSLSDIRLKENISDATSKLSDICKLRVVNFNFIGDEKKHIGFVAQELQEVFPSLVSAKDTRRYDDEGNVISGYEDTLRVRVSMEFAIAVKAIQEQQALIETQQTQIDTLQTTVTDLLARVEALEAV